MYIKNLLCIVKVFSLKKTMKSTNRGTYGNRKNH